MKKILRHMPVILVLWVILGFTGVALDNMINEDGGSFCKWFLIAHFSIFTPVFLYSMIPEKVRS